MIKNKIIFNCYGDSIGSSCEGLLSFLEGLPFQFCFTHLYLLPSIFNYDLDRGFSIVSYDLNSQLINPDNLERIKGMGLSVILDFVLNHLSSNSPQFQDIVQKGKQSRYYDFFVDWNAFWDERGSLNSENVIIPNDIDLAALHKRKPMLPCLSFKDDTGEQHVFWNTFYQHKPDNTHWSGQMDLNIQSPLVWDYYRETLYKLIGYGASVIRLDAFPYLSKIPGRRNFFNEPESWAILKQVQSLTPHQSVELLPEIHSPYQDGVYEKIGQNNYLLYDYFLPGLILDALFNNDPTYLVRWGNEIVEKNLNTISMLSSHDGIPINDLRGLLPKHRLDELENNLIQKGGIIKKLYGKENQTYQVFCSYFSALGEDKDALLLARAIQLFFPGNPQIYYYDLLCGTNNNPGIDPKKEETKREINRRNLSLSEAKQALTDCYILKQLRLIDQVRTKLFNQQFDIRLSSEGPKLTIVYHNDKQEIRLEADLVNKSFIIEENK